MIIPPIVWYFIYAITLCLMIWIVAFIAAVAIGWWWLTIPIGLPATWTACDRAMEWATGQPIRTPRLDRLRAAWKARRKR